jgi:hypothetical protein
MVETALQAFVHVHQAHANAVQVFQAAGCSSNALLQHGHSYFVGHCRRIDEEGVCHRDKHLGREPKLRIFRELFRLQEKLPDFQRRGLP